MWSGSSEPTIAASLPTDDLKARLARTFHQGLGFVGAGRWRWGVLGMMACGPADWTC
jgi:hypothetical protein